MVTVNIDEELNKNVLIIGAGEGGGRIAQEFYSQGFINTIVINTAKADLDGLDIIPKENKYLINATNGEGAGKDPQVVRAAIDSYYNDVTEFIKSKLSGQDRIYICTCGGGGSGGGLGIVLAEITSQLVNNVGMIFTLPIKNESTLVFINALNNLNEIYENVKNSSITPFIVVDNNELYDRYNSSVSNFWKPINNEIVRVVRAFNELSQKPSKYISALDRKDLQRLLSVGGSCAIGSVDINSVDTSDVIIDKINKSFFMQGFDLTTSKSAGLIILGNEETLSTPESSKFVNTIFDKVGSLLGGGMYFRGVYADKDVKFLKVYVIFNGMVLPEDRIGEMMKEINTGYGKIKSQENRVDGVFFGMDKRVQDAFGGVNSNTSKPKIVRNDGFGGQVSPSSPQIQQKPKVNIPGIQRKER